MTTNKKGAPIVRKKDASPPPPLKIELGRGVNLYAHALGSFAQSEAAALVNAELDALVAGEPTRFDWDFTPDEVTKLKNPDLKRMVFGSMLAVAKATASVERVEGVVEEDGAPVQPAHDFFVWLFKDVALESAFRLKALGLDRMWSAEGNASGRAPNGAGAEASKPANGAAPSIHPAPTDAASSSMTAISDASGASAPSSNTNLEPAPAPQPGQPPRQSDSGSDPA